MIQYFCKNIKFITYLIRGIIYEKNIECVPGASHGAAFRGGLCGGKSDGGDRQRREHHPGGAECHDVCPGCPDDPIRY